MEIKLVNWQYCKDLDEINNAILNKDDDNWEGLTSAKDIISITYDMNRGLYLVIWRIDYED